MRNHRSILTIFAISRTDDCGATYRFANYSWDNEIVPIKQSLQVGLTMLTGLFMVGLPILLSTGLVINLYFAMYLVASILFIVSVILFLLLSRIRTLS